jgi:phosphopantothenoylcysteine decarboxylase/phosphopantothenate--cysteine ligase
MASLTNKRILLGVTGGIAAYKSADLTRRLRDAGAEVRVVMTQGATEFITPLTLQAVSGQPVRLHLLDTEAESGMGHIELARWADAVLVAPASADFLARLAQGRADDLLTTLCLAHDGVVAAAPAMNSKMWENPATRDNLALLEARGVRVFGPASGSQACGEVGLGRMLEPVELVTLTARLFDTGSLEGVKVVITAGPTWEAIDPVRGLTNRSSGKMGYAVAEAAIEAGAAVTLISGPTALPAPERATLVRVTSAQEMYDAVHAHIAGAGIFIGVAAVADYRPKTVAAGKIKKTAAMLTLELVRNPDILASVAALEPRPYTVGFAAETGDLVEHARAKLEAKRVDLVAVNPVGRADTGFDSDTNSLTLVAADGVAELPLLPKTRLARALIDHIAQSYHAQDPAQDPRRAHRH